MTIERLRELVAAEKLVILELQAWREVERRALPWRECWDDGHYVVLVAIDDEFAYFMDPSTDDSYTYMPLSELLERWHDINQTRKECKDQWDIHLGVIIDGTILGEKPKPETRHLSRLE